VGLPDRLLTIEAREMLFMGDDRYVLVNCLRDLRLEAEGLPEGSEERIKLQRAVESLRTVLALPSRGRCPHCGQVMPRSKC
jgi:tRNA C32,U32 (ribose-2'-O)-methylase TrmJ